MATREPAAQRDDWTRAIEGIEYPTGLFGLRRAIMDRGGLDHEVLDIVNRLPEESDFESEDQLLAAVRAAYAADGLTSPI